MCNTLKRLIAWSYGNYICRVLFMSQFSEVSLGSFAALSKISDVKSFKRLLPPQFSSNFNQKVYRKHVIGWKYRLLPFSGDLPNFKITWHFEYKFPQLQSITICWFHLAKGQAENQSPRASFFNLSPVKMHVPYIKTSNPAAWSSSVVYMESSCNWMRKCRHWQLDFILALVDYVCRAHRNSSVIQLSTVRLSVALIISESILYRVVGCHGQNTVTFLNISLKRPFSNFS